MRVYEQTYLKQPNFAESTEILEYAVRIGIAPDKEPQLLHLARDGLMQALPADWKVW